MILPRRGNVYARAVFPKIGGRPARRETVEARVTVSVRLSTRNIGRLKGKIFLAV